MSSGLPARIELPDTALYYKGTVEMYEQAGYARGDDIDAGIIKHGQWIVAQGDATGVAFRAAARGHGFAIETLATDSHSYADAMDALEKAILAHLARAGSDGATPLYDGDTELENTD